MTNMICTQRLYLTADKQKLVAEGDPAAAFFYAAPGHEIPAEMAEKFGLVDGALPEKKGGKKAEPAAKPADAAETKPAAAAETKGA